MTNLLTIFTSVMFIIVILTGVSFVADEVAVKNDNLDTLSIQIINQTSNELNTNYNSSQLAVTDTELTENSSFEAVDPFSRQYLEDKSEIDQKKGVIDKAIGMPDLMLMSIGIEQPAILLAIKSFFIVTLTFIIGLALYIAIRTGEVK